MDWFEDPSNTASNAFAVMGYVAAVLVFSTFYMKTMLPLRIIAIASNLAFISYAILGHLLPVFILHSTLLPLNLWRLFQIRKLLRDMAAAQAGDFSIDILVPFMTTKNLKAGEILFRKGDSAEELYVLKKGFIRLPEVGVLLRDWDMIGEIGILSRQRKRMATALIESDCTVLSLTSEKAIQLYYQNPTFGFYVFQLVIDRLLTDLSRDAASSKISEIQSGKSASVPSSS